ncbi:MAG: Gfo/Idh/MocA family oxidoreductase, partial [Tepidisphaeraceae bacterium]
VCRYRFSRVFAPSPAPAWRLDPAQSGGGIFLDVGSHVLDILDFLLGPFIEYGGAAHRTGAQIVEDVVAVHFRTEGGVVGAASWNFAASLAEERLEIDGTEGRLSMEVLGCTPLTVSRAGKAMETIDLPDPPHVQQPLIQAVVDELLGRGTCPSTGASAARTSAVMDAALTSFYRGRDDAFWERPATWGAPHMTWRGWH